MAGCANVPRLEVPQWYPGSARFDMLREQALALQRPSNFHNEQKKRKMSLREELEDMGFEILD